MEEEKFDVVSRPKHYCSGGTECIDAMLRIFGKKAVMWFCLLNCFKYLWRCDLKNGEEDISKAKWYFNKFKSIIGG